MNPAEQAHVRHYGQVADIIKTLGLPHTWTAIRTVEAYLVLYQAGVNRDVTDEQLGFMLAGISLGAGNGTADHLLTLLAASIERPELPPDQLTAYKEDMAKLRALYRARN